MNWQVWSSWVNCVMQETLDWPPNTALQVAYRVGRAVNLQGSSTSAGLPFTLPRHGIVAAEPPCNCLALLSTAYCEEDNGGSCKTRGGGGGDWLQMQQPSSCSLYLWRVNGRKRILKAEPSLDLHFLCDSLCFFQIGEWVGSEHKTNNAILCMTTQ